MTAVAQPSRIQSDALASPLLRLPAEIRNHIFRYVVGDQFIHLHRFASRNGKRFAHTICTATQSESSVYEEFKLGFENTRKENSEEHPTIPFQSRHAHCKPWALTAHARTPWRQQREEQHKRPSNGVAQVSNLKLDLTLLRACQQTYAECDLLFWTTNTFSFEDACTLREFVDQMTTTQRKKLTTIHVEKQWRGYEWDDWSELMNVTFLEKLGSLKTLHLTFFISPWVYIEGCCIQAPINSDDTEPTYALKMLSPNTVTVVIADHDEDYVKESLKLHRWTASKKREVAEKFREKLLDPNGNAIFTQEGKAKAAGKNRIFKNIYYRMFHQY